MGFVLEDRLRSYERCCPDEGEACAEDKIIDCHAAEMFLRKSHATCCESEGEDCPDDSLRSCDRIEHVISRVLLDPERVDVFEKCCPDDGEDCPEEDYDCHDTAKYLHTAHTTCCPDEGEDCPPGTEDSCERIGKMFLLEDAAKYLNSSHHHGSSPLDVH